MKRDDYPILILECANAHGGNYDSLRSTVDAFSEINYARRHIKFQPLQAGAIALPDYKWYPTYKILMFDDEQWCSIIEIANKQYDGVWLDLFDVFGVNVLSNNLDSITGVKLQASVIENQEILSALADLKLEHISLMINVSGYELLSVKKFMEQFELLEVKELIVQIGHQSYPTNIEDSGLQKIGLLREAFPYLKICIADHISAEDDMATILPLLGVASGCSMVEKHICLDRDNAEFDYYSALEFDEMQLLATRLSQCPSILSGLYVSKSENNYLLDSAQIPILSYSVPRGSMISSKNVIFRRTDQTGMTWNDICEVQKNGFILNQEVKIGETIKIDYFRKARIGVIVACRMKSSRLKRKALLKINGKSSIEVCLENCLRMSRAETVILATSTEEEDAILENCTLSGKVKFWQGDPDDVIRRYLDASDEYNVDVIVRVTGDCPLISPEIAEILLNHHFSTGADFTAAENCAVGTGCEIYNAEILRRVVSYLGEAKHSEYMTWYMKNNSEIFKVEEAVLPEWMIRDYRLTLDYQEDYQLFKKIFVALEKEERDATLENILGILDEDAELANINSHLALKYVEDEELIGMLNRETKISLP